MATLCSTLLMIQPSEISFPTWLCIWLSMSTLLPQKLSISNLKSSNGCPEIKIPTNSFSLLSASILPHSSQSAIIGSEIFTSPSPVSNKLPWLEFFPSEIAFPYLIAVSTVVLPCTSGVTYCALCTPPSKESNPPAIARLSRVLLLAALKSILEVKSKIELNFPSSFLVLIMDSTAPSPTPFIAPIPKRIAPLSFTANLKYDSFTSGSKTSIPIRLHSSIKKVTDLMSFMLLDSTEAMYSAG